MTFFRNGDFRLKIIEFVPDHPDWSYQLVADRFGVSRNVVAGILFRRRHSYKTLICSPNSNAPNKIGAGWQPPKYQPRFNATNTRGAIGP